MMTVKKIKQIAFITVLTMMSVSCGQRQPKTEISSENEEVKTEPEINVSYQITGDNNNELVGVVEGQKYKIDLSDDIMCLRIIEQVDFDEDGLTDALIEHNPCGGNSALNTYFFVSYKGRGFFQVTKEFGYSWEDPVIEKWNNQTSVLVESMHSGYNNDETGNVKERYILKDGKALPVESMKKNELVVLKEIRASEFSYDNPDEIKYLYFDLDGDNVNDKITCTFWVRWGEILISEIEFSSGTTMGAISSGCKRVGVLETKTDNVRDLVCGDDHILRWNGKKYE